MGDRLRVLGLVNAAWSTQAIAAACELGLPDIMGEVPLPAATLSADVHAHEDSVRRLLRALVTLGLCEESPAGAFSLTVDGGILRADHPQSVSAWARMSGAQVWNNWALLARSVRTGESARRELQGADDFGYLDADASRAAVFNAAMVDLTRPVAEAAAQAIDWSGIRSTVDVGGGMGELLAVVASRHPHLHGVVYDLQHAVAGAREHLARRGVAGRCEVVSGSFFDAVPPGHDAYLLKSVLHNWDDASARRILARVREAMPPRAHVLILDRVLPETLTPADRDLARSDLNMLVGCGGRERTEAEFRLLLESAGLAYLSVKPLVGGMSVITGEIGATPPATSQSSSRPPSVTARAFRPG